MKNVYTKKMLAADVILELEKEDFSIEKLCDFADYILKNKYLIDPEGFEFLQLLRTMHFGEDFEIDKQELRRRAIELIEN